MRFEYIAGIYDHVFRDTWPKALTHDACNKFFITTFSNCFSSNFATLSLSSAFLASSSAFSNEPARPVILARSLAFSSLSKASSDSITLFIQAKKIMRNICKSYVTLALAQPQFLRQEFYRRILGDRSRLLLRILLGYLFDRQQDMLVYIMFKK